jgi:D-alanyl-D-alanine dipeptidase
MRCGSVLLAVLLFASAAGLAGAKPQERQEQGFHITPVRPVEELRREALQASPPPQPAGLRSPELVDLASLDGSIRFDIRYAGSNNFMGTPFYTEARAFLQRPAAEALLRVQLDLAKQGYGLVVYDAYRPWYVTKMFWEGTPLAMRRFVADPAIGSRHNRGCAVDLSLYRLSTGDSVEMPSAYDEMSERAYAEYAGGTAEQRRMRDLLRSSMEREGFVVLPLEWWHFDYSSCDYPVMNIPFKDLPVNLHARP